MNLLTMTGLSYVGQSGDIDKRLKQHERAEKIKPGSQISVKEAEGGRIQREVAEHGPLQEITGCESAVDSPLVANKKGPIGPKRGIWLMNKNSNLTDLSIPSRKCLQCYGPNCALASCCPRIDCTRKCPVVKVD